MNTNLIKLKMLKINFILVTILFITANACSNEPEPIIFGTDQCDHCRMKIMDKKYGAELITKKSKVFKFDAAECMVNYLSENNINEGDIDKLLVITVNDPGNFTDAKSAVYLISPKLKSPMGENISAFSNRNDADKFFKDFGGELTNWDGVKRKVTGN